MLRCIVTPFRNDAFQSMRQKMKKHLPLSVFPQNLCGVSTWSFSVFPWRHPQNRACSAPHFGRLLAWDRLQSNLWSPWEDLGGEISGARGTVETPHGWSVLDLGLSAGGYPKLGDPISTGMMTGGIPMTQETSAFYDILWIMKLAKKHPKTRSRLRSRTESRKTTGWDVASPCRKRWKPRQRDLPGCSDMGSEGDIRITPLKYGGPGDPQVLWLPKKLQSLGISVTWNESWASIISPSLKSWWFFVNPSNL